MIIGSDKASIVDWTPWFAWHPVRTTDGKWRWLEMVERIYYLSGKLSLDDYRKFGGINFGYRKSSS